MALKRLKPYTERLFEPLSRMLSERGVEPNHVSLTGVFLSFLSGLFFYLGWQFWGGVFLAFSGVCDLLDGNMARTQDKDTPFGAFLDSTLDRYSDMFVLLGIMGFAFLKRDALLFWLTAAALVGSVMVSYTRARAECIIDRCDVGLMERPERMVVLAVSALLGYVDWGVALVAVLSNITALQRILYTRRRIKGDV